VKKYIFSKFAKWLIGGDLFDAIKEIVAVYMDSSLDGATKRELVKKRVREFAKDTSEFIINLGIELAVYQLKKWSEK
jgi:hypothetical protein